MVNLEALANDLRAAGYHVADDGEPLRVGINTPERYGTLCRVFSDKEVYWNDRTPLDWGAAAIIARHLGAGQSVAADRAVRWATILRVSDAIKAREYALDIGSSLSYGEIAETAIDAVEAAGWGPRAEPVAGTGETLYRRCPHCPGDGTSCWTCDDEGYVPVAPPDDRTVNCHVCGEYIGVRFGEVYPPGDDICTTCIAELAARFAVPVEGA